MAGILSGVIACAMKQAKNLHPPLICLAYGWWKTNTNRGVMQHGILNFMDTNKGGEKNVGYFCRLL
jgi:hypothetical protein